MKKANPLIASILLVMLCASVTCLEYHLVQRFEYLPSFLAGVFGLFVLLLVALLRAVEGYEDESGFHIRVVAVPARHLFAMTGFPN